MNSKLTVLFWVGPILLAHGSAAGQSAGSLIGIPPGPSAPIVTIQAATTGALVRGRGAGNSTLDMGRVSYFAGTTSPGLSRQKKKGAFVISTRFAVTIDCPGSSPSARVYVAISRVDAASSHSIVVDGTTLGQIAQTLVQSMPCGTPGEHRLEVEVPVSTPSGSIGSSLAFVATLIK